MTRCKSIRFGANNFIEDAMTTVTSSMTYFGKENFVDPARTKVFRFNGNFTITASNNRIYINDDANKEIELTNASYNGGAALAAHVQARLNAASTNWLCTYSSVTYKFTISRSSGTDILHFATTADAAWDTLGYTATINESAATGGIADRPRIHTHERVTIDLGTPTEITEFHCIASIAELFGVSTTATLRLMGNTSNAFTSPALTVNPLRDKGGIHHYLDNDDDISTTYRYWAFDIVDRENITSGPQGIKIGYLYLGDYETVTSTNVVPGFTKTYEDPSEDIQSESGVRYFRVRQKVRLFDAMTIGFIQANDRRSLEALFETVGIYTPFFLCIDPTNAVSDNLSEVTLYGRFKDEPKFQHALRDLYAMVFSIEESV